MKKLTIVLTVVAISCTGLFAKQSDIVEDIFKKYSKLDGVEVVDISGFLLNIMCQNDEELKHHNLNGIKVLSINDPGLNNGINFYKEIVPELELNDYKQLVRVTEKNEQVIILAKEKDGIFEEFLIVVGGSDNTLVSIKGHIDMNHFQSIEKMIDVDVDVDLDID